MKTKESKMIKIISILSVLLFIVTSFGFFTKVFDDSSMNIYSLIMGILYLVLAIVILAKNKISNFFIIILFALFSLITASCMYENIPAIISIIKNIDFEDGLYISELINKSLNIAGYIMICLFLFFNVKFDKKAKALSITSNLFLVLSMLVSDIYVLYTGCKLNLMFQNLEYLKSKQFEILTGANPSSKPNVINALIDTIPVIVPSLLLDLSNIIGIALLCVIVYNTSTEKNLTK